MPSPVSASFRRRKMSTVDTAWLRMDSDGNKMMIVGVAMMNSPMSIDGLKEALTTRFLVYSRFRSRVVEDATGYWWQEQAVDLDDHVIHEVLNDAPGGASNKHALQLLVGRLAQQSLDFSIPLWTMHLVDNCVGEDGRVRQALIVRIHHCIADGIALVGVFMSMFGAHPDAPPQQPTPAAVKAAEQNPWEQILMPVTMASVKTIDLSTELWLRSYRFWADLPHIGEKLYKLGSAAAQLTADTVKLTAMDMDSPTRLKGKPNGKKHVAWSEPMPLPEVKAIAKAYGCSINDVLLASVAGALRAYLVSKGDAVAADCDVRVMVPVNLRKASGQHKLGNAFGLVPLVLPVGIEDPVARVKEVQARMNDLKGSYTALVAMSVLGVLGATPKLVQSEVQNYFARRATAVMSNVPGPQTPLFMAGSQLDQVMFWVPQSGDIGIGVSILSYNGGVQFGIITDDALVQDPEAIIERFAPEFEKLVLWALMSAEY